jgi:membrane fusion protein, multidrug efflux system
MKTFNFMLLVILLAGCSDEGVPGTDREIGPANVSVSEVGVASSAEAHVGALEPAQEAVVATRIAGRVQEILVHEGQLVQAGESLVRLDATDIDAAIGAAEAQVVLAERFFSRMDALARDGAAAQQELDEAAASLEVARAGLEGAVAQRAYVELSAPFDGVVKERQADPGTLALPGQALLVVQSRTASTVRLELPGELWERSSVGTIMRVLDAQSGWATDATVTRRAPAIGDASRRFRVELSVASVRGGPLPGTLVDVIVEGAGLETVWVPADAIFERGQLSGVFAIVGDTVRLRWIRIGVRDGDRVEVLAGMPAGGRVVRDPSTVLVDGTPVGQVTPVPWDPSGARSRQEGDAP